MPIGIKRTDEERTELEQWQELLEQAENWSSSDSEDVFEITVAEVLGIGHYIMKPPEVTVVRDTDGKIWVLSETQDSDGDLQGLVSRYNVRPGMVLRLRVTKEVQKWTSVFPITPEKQPA